MDLCPVVLLDISKNSMNRGKNYMEPNGLYEKKKLAYWCVCHWNIKGFHSAT